jgi:hypothetical protein
VVGVVVTMFDLLLIGWHFYDSLWKSAAGRKASFAENTIRSRG